MTLNKDDLTHFMVWLEHNYAIGFSGDDMINIPKTYVETRPPAYEMPNVEPAGLLHEITTVISGGAHVFDVHVCSCGMYLNTSLLARKHVAKANAKI